MRSKKYFPHLNELLIWGYPENFVKIGLMVEALDEFCGRGRDGRGGEGRGRDAIVKTTSAQAYGFWLGLA